LEVWMFSMHLKGEKHRVHNKRTRRIKKEGGDRARTETSVAKRSGPRGSQSETKSRFHAEKEKEVHQNVKVVLSETHVQKGADTV